MKILVCMKQVPQKDAPLKLNEAGTWIRQDVSNEVNEPDAFALEEALRQKEKHSGEVVVVIKGGSGARAAGIARGSGQGGESRHPSRGRWLCRARCLQHRARDCGGHQRRAVRPHLYGLAIGRLRIRADGRDSGRNSRLAARHHHHAD